jgi:hypothetical protein
MPIAWIARRGKERYSRQEMLFEVDARKTTEITENLS